MASHAKASPLGRHYIWGDQINTTGTHTHTHLSCTHNIRSNIHEQSLTSTVVETAHFTDYVIRCMQDWHVIEQWHKQVWRHQSLATERRLIATYDKRIGGAWLQSRTHRLAWNAIIYHQHEYDGCTKCVYGTLINDDLTRFTECYVPLTVQRSLNSSNSSMIGQ